MTGGVPDADQTPPRRRVLWLAGALAVGMALISAARWRVVTDITHFLPSGTDHALATISRQLADSTLTRTLILSIRGGDADAARLAATAVAERLEHHPEVAWVQRGPTTALAETVYRLYAPRLPYFISERPEAEIPAALGDDGLAAATRSLKSQLALPTAPMLSRLAASDPLQWFPSILRRLERAQARALDVDGDQLFTRDHQHAIIFVGTRHSPFNSASQVALLDEIARAFADANTKAHGTLVLERAGVAPIAVDAERRIRRDLERISVFSTIGVAVLFLALFGSVRSALLALLPVLGGALTATAVGFLLFGELHSMTLAIGSSLIGVAIDYPILLLTHLVLAPGAPVLRVLRRVWVGILLGGLTTAAGFAALGWTTFPGVRELALTSSVGIIAALLVTRYVLPPLLAGRSPRAPLLWMTASGAARALTALNRRRWLPALSLVVAMAICLIGLPRLRWMDSLAALNGADPQLKAEADRVRARVSNFDEGRLVIATGATPEQALAVNDQIAGRLDDVQRSGALTGFVSLHAFLWSASLQERNRATVAAVPNLGPRTVEALTRQGFRAESFAPFVAAMAALHGIAGPVAASSHAPAPTPPLRLADLTNSPLAPLVRPFVIELGSDTGILTFLRGVRQPAAIEAAMAGVPGARFFDQSAFLNQTYAHFRVQTLQAVGLGLVLILVVLQLRYRRWRNTLAALMPAVLAALATLGVLGLAGVAANLLHVLSLLLVLSMGVDYGVFLVESTEGFASGATLVSLCASCGTTLLSFGLLAVSGTPALRAIGLTVGIGILLSLALATIAITLPHARRRGQGQGQVGESAGTHQAEEARP